MSQWLLIDYMEPADGPDEFPKLAIGSEGQLRQELIRLRDREPSIVCLVVPDEEGLQIGIGGPFAGLKWADYPKSNNYRRLLADRLYSPNPVDFKCEEDFLVYDQSELIPFAQAMEIILHFYKHGSLPDHVNWKAWDDKTKTWRMRLETPAPPSDCPVILPEAVRPDRIVHAFCPTCSAVLQPPSEGATEQVCPHCGARMATRGRPD